MHVRNVRAMVLLAAILSTGHPTLAQWSSGNLSAERYSIHAVEVGGVVLFAGGTFAAFDDVVDIYHASTDSWSTHLLADPRIIYGPPVRVGMKAFLIGGVHSSTQTIVSTVDIYDAATNSWSVTTMPRERAGFTPVVIGNKILIAGGTNPATDIVDVYDVATDTWSVDSLSVARNAMAGAAVGQFAIFAGGRFQTSFSTHFDTVDIYDSVSDTWSVAQLSQPRSNILAETVGSKVLFAGGGDGWPISVVDIFDASTGTWSTAHLGLDRGLCHSVTVDSKVLLIGGGVFDPVTLMPTYYRFVDIYDDETGQWSSGELTNYCGGGATVVGGKVIIAGQWWRKTAYDYPEPQPIVDIYDASADLWYRTEIPVPRRILATATVGDKAMFAGGVSLTAVHDEVDIYEELGDEYCVAGPNSTGRGAEMFVLGSKSLADDTLGLMAGPIPDSLTLFAYSTSTASAPFGNGFVCLGQPRYALGEPVMASGEIARKRVHMSQFAFVPGSLNFQCFYRDPAAGGAGFNASNGYTIDFVP